MKTRIQNECLAFAYWLRSRSHDPKAAALYEAIVATAHKLKRGESMTPDEMACIAGAIAGYGAIAKIPVMENIIEYIAVTMAAVLEVEDNEA